MEIANTKFPSIKQLVEFTNVMLEYPEDQNLKCTFRLLNYKSQEGDRIAIYILGWATVKDYLVFEWVPVNDAKENSVMFNQSVLPKNSPDMFQFCYISSENRTYGVSEPFQFTNPNIKLPSSDCCLKSLNSNSDFTLLNCGREMVRLKEENKIFRDKLQTFMNMLINTQTLLCQQQREINSLREKCDRLEENNVSLNLKQSLCNNSFRKSLSGVCKEFDIGELETLPPFPFAK